MHIEGLNTQQIKKSELHTNSLAFGAKPITTSVGQRITDKAMKILGAAAASITAATIALSKKAKTSNNVEQLDNTTFVTNIATDEDLAETYKIDLEAFDGRYEISPNLEHYKQDLKEQNVTTYAIKTQNGDVVGYYQLEPVEDGELYVHSMAIRKDLRATRASVAVLNQIKDEILKIAIEKDVDKIALDVEADNKSLIRLYEKYGFKITDTVEVSTPQGMRSDHYMEIDVKKHIAESQETNQEKPIEICNTVLQKKSTKLSYLRLDNF